MPTFPKAVTALTSKELEALARLYHKTANRLSVDARLAPTEELRQRRIVSSRKARDHARELLQLAATSCMADSD